MILAGTVTGRMGCIPISPVNVTFFTVTLTQSFGLNRPLILVSQSLSDIHDNDDNELYFEICCITLQAWYSWLPW